MGHPVAAIILIHVAADFLPASCHGDSIQDPGFASIIGLVTHGSRTQARITVFSR